MAEQLYYKGKNVQDLVMEAIKFQDGKLFAEFTAVVHDIEQLPTRKAMSAAFADGRLADLVMRHTGLDVYFFTDNEYSPFQKNYNAAMYVPQLTKNNPLYTDLHVAWGFVEDTDAKRLLRTLKEKTVGTVDLVNSRVGGAFSKLTMRSYITLDLLADKRFTAGQKAAIMMHEIGHAFTWIEMIAETACFNMAIMCAARHLLANDDEQKRIQLAEALNECLNVQVDPKTMAESSKVETWYTVYLKAEVEERRLAANSGYYADTASEFLADQFAVRHGAGRELAGAMNLMFKYYRLDSTKSRMVLWVKMAYQVTSFILKLAGAVMGALVNPLAGGFALLYMLANVAVVVISDANYNIYDWDKERIARMKRELITRIKDPMLDDVTRKETLETIKELDETERSLNNYKNFQQQLAYWLNPKARRNVKQRDMQQEIERTLNNDIFVASGNIGLIGKTA